MKLENLLLTYRKKAGLSQEQVGNEIGVTRQTISKWENGQSVPEADKIISLAELYNVSVETLLTGEEILKTNDHNRSDYTILKVIGYIGLLLLLLVVLSYVLFGFNRVDQKSNDESTQISE